MLALRGHDDGTRGVPRVRRDGEEGGGGGDRSHDEEHYQTPKSDRG
jgi:hypothetical protein